MRSNSRSIKDVNILISKFAPLSNFHIDECKNLLKENKLNTILVFVRDINESFNTLTKEMLIESVNKYSFIESIYEFSDIDLTNIVESLSLKYSINKISTDENIVLDKQYLDIKKFEHVIIQKFDNPITMDSFKDEYTTKKHTPLFLQLYFESFNKIANKKSKLEETKTLSKAKNQLERQLDNIGVEIYLDNAKKFPALIISVDELIKAGNEQPEIQKAIEKVLKRNKNLKIDNDNSNDFTITIEDELLSESINLAELFSIENNVFSIDDIMSVINENTEMKSMFYEMLFTVAEIYKNEEMKESELSELFKETIIELSKLPSHVIKSLK